MLDPRVQQKGGFGAFAARQQERHDARAASKAQAAPEAATGPAAAVRAGDADALAAGQSDARPAEKIRPHTRDSA